MKSNRDIELELRLRRRIIASTLIFFVMSLVFYLLGAIIENCFIISLWEVNLRIGIATTWALITIMLTVVPAIVTLEDYN